MTILGTDEVEDEVVTVTEGIAVVVRVADNGEVPSVMGNMLSDGVELLDDFGTGIGEWGRLWRPHVSLIWFKSAIILSQSVLSSVDDYREMFN